MTYAFIDTNLLMHFKVFEGMNWKQLLGDKDYCIMIAPTVLDEVDKHKDSSKTKLRNRAKKIFKILSGYLDGKSFNNINLAFCYEDCTIDFSSSEYSNAREDDYIIAYAKAFTTNERKVVVSNDIGMKFRAKKASLDFVMPDSSSENILSQEPTEEEKTIKELTRQLEEFQNRMAKPELRFRNDARFLSFQTFRQPNLDSVLSQYEDELRKEFPFRYKNSSLISSPLLDLVNTLNLYSDEDIDRYNDAIDPYIERMVELKRISMLHKELDKYVYELQFSILNLGNAPTGQIGLKIFFPESMRLLSKKSYVKKDFTPPDKPRLETEDNKKLREAIEGVRLQNFHYHPIYGLTQTPPENQVLESYWDVRKTISNNYFKQYNPVTHCMRLDFEIPDKLFVVADKPGTHIIKWVIIDSSNPNTINGELTIELL